MVPISFASGSRVRKLSSTWELHGSFLVSSLFAELLSTPYNKVNRGSYMSAHSCIIEFIQQVGEKDKMQNKLEKKIRCEAMPSILLGFPQQV